MPLSSGSRKVIKALCFVSAKLYLVVYFFATWILCGLYCRQQSWGDTSCQIMQRCSWCPVTHHWMKHTVRSRYCTTNSVSVSLLYAWTGRIGGYIGAFESAAAWRNIFFPLRRPKWTLKGEKTTTKKYKKWFILLFLGWRWCRMNKRHTGGKKKR